MAKRKDRRELIIEAAKKVIGDNGVSGATLRAIAEAAEISTGAIYHHFKSKEELLYAIMDESLNMSATIDTDTQNRKPERQEVIDAICLQITKRFEKSEDNRIQFYLAKEAMMGDAALLEKFNAKYHDWRSHSESLMTYLYGLLPSKYNEALSALLIGAIDGVVMQMLLGTLQTTPETFTEVYRILLEEELPKIVNRLQSIEGATQE